MIKDLPAITFAVLGLVALTACQTDQDIGWQGRSSVGTELARQSAPAAVQGRWHWQMRTTEALCQGAHTTPLEIRGNSIEGGVSHSGDPGLARVTGQIDEAGNIRMWASGKYTFVSFVGRLADGKGEGTAEAKGEINCHGVWIANKL